MSPTHSWSEIYTHEYMSLVWQCEGALSFEASQRPAMVKSSETAVNESCRPSLEAMAVILPLVMMSIYSKAFAAPAMNFEGRGCEPSRLPLPVPHGSSLSGSPPSMARSSGVDGSELNVLEQERVRARESARERGGACA